MRKMSNYVQIFSLTIPLLNFLIELSNLAIKEEKKKSKENEDPKNSSAIF